MKLKAPIFIFLFCFIALSVNAQSINGVKSYPLYKQGAKLVNELDVEGNEIVRIEYDLIFSSKETYRYLSPDWEYTIQGFADGGVAQMDLKIYVYDDLIDEWNLLKTDQMEGAAPYLTITPPESAQYKIEIIVTDFYEGYNVARYGLIFYHD